MKHYKLVKYKNTGDAGIKDFICSEELKQRFYSGVKLSPTINPKIVIENKSGKPQDFIMGGTALPIISKKVKELLLTLPESNKFEFISTNVENLNSNTEYWVLNILDILDCVDFDKSEYRTYNNSEKIKRIDKLVFKEGAINKDIFYLKDFPVDIYVSEKIATLFNENDITGYKLIDIE
ncbi:DUF1629 domain-containing protein [uncultured Dokdonia sp.]|uniref:imm11 family protein n=1 Tax=uncultured Dokdonia sp. TaxID=575653 RepID=UPI002615AC3B|nr:DUF1629 domain-containing protein [uncultured Dokdonia sp.]